MGTDLDPVNEQTKDITNEEGDIVDEEIEIWNPENANIIPNTETTHTEKLMLKKRKIFRQKYKA